MSPHLIGRNTKTCCVAAVDWSEYITCCVAAVDWSEYITCCLAAVDWSEYITCCVATVDWSEYITCCVAVVEQPTEGQPADEGRPGATDDDQPNPEAAGGGKEPAREQS